MNPQVDTDIFHGPDVALFAFALAAKASIVITDKAEEATITSGYIRDMTIPLP